MIMDVITRVKQDGPVQGKRFVNGHKFEVWFDASTLATGVFLELNGDLVEDAFWLRLEKDVQHIPVVELNAVLRGVNVALQ